METPDQPRRNPMYPWLRVLLWMLPAGFVAVSVFGVSVLVPKFSVDERLLSCVWVALNLAFVVGVGWCDYTLASDSVSKSYRPWTYILSFSLGQIILAPSLLALAVFAISSMLAMN